MIRVFKNKKRVDDTMVRTQTHIKNDLYLEYSGTAESDKSRKLSLLAESTFLM